MFLYMHFFPFSASGFWVVLVLFLFFFGDGHLVPQDLLDVSI